MTKRGEPLPINQALNRPRAKLGSRPHSMDGDRIRLRNGFPRWVPHRGDDRPFPSLAGGAWLIVRKHPKMFELWGLSLSQRSYYDPRKH